MVRAAPDEWIAAMLDQARTVMSELNAPEREQLGVPKAPDEHDFGVCDLDLPSRKWAHAHGMTDETKLYVHPPTTAASAHQPKWTLMAQCRPPWDEDRKVLCYTEGYDYGGTSFIVLKASAFYEVDEDDQLPGTAEARTVSHWIWCDDIESYLTRLMSEPSSSPYNARRIAWELERTALGDGFYGNALRVAKDMPGVSSAERALLDKFANGTPGHTDHVALQALALRLCAAANDAAR
jgi:hypothetical protein